ncbi:MULTISPECIES: restriction endonuclease subunit S [Haemophilus]|jgi:type I restriction modification DNA specificity domain protein|uniref:restriction endonuclease subunit S n=1 Tax=Haemophilus TaxID=724 RepID=UPI00069D6614|nr:MULTISPECIES: restriction endonuclease subunit S [Haemophilus]RDF00613.1 restriction endonuclease subunit S [Haemophilus parainfluenzae]
MIFTNMKLSELCVEISYGYTASATDNNTGCKFLRITDIQGGYVDWNKVPFCEIESKDISKYQLIEGDIVIARTGNSTGENFIFQGKDNAVFASYLIRYRVNKEIANPYYIWLNLRSSNWWGFVSGAKSGSAQAGANAKVLGTFEIPIPDLQTQNKIADFFQHINNKIQLNTQINQTLEQIAQALFKSWFVDFDPVRAKVQALSDGLSLEQAELAAMQAISRKTPEELTALSQTQPDRYAELAETAKAFPCEMVEVDGVEVPKGWRIGTFTDITESRREKVKNDKAMVLSAVSSGELVKSEEYFTKQVFSKSIDKYLKVYKWDFAYNPARINIGSIGLHEADYLGAVSPVYEVFSVSDKYHWFLKRILNLETTKIKIQSLCTGSVRQTLKLKDFQSIDCVIPDEKTLSIFNKKWEEYRTLILENNKNTQTLSEIRDLLLPRLLSGKIEND